MTIGHWAERFQETEKASPWMRPGDALHLMTRISGREHTPVGYKIWQHPQSDEKLTSLGIQQTVPQEHIHDGRTNWPSRMEDASLVRRNHGEWGGDTQ